MGAPGVGFALTNLSFDLPGHTSGKVRESWQLADRQRLLVTSDRLSAFDRVVGLVPHKGQVLNQLAAWWFEQTADIVANHVIAVPDPIALIATEAVTLPVEVVVRGRLTGSTSTSILPRYRQGERVLYGHHLPDGIEDHGALPAPIITPTTKAESGGHDAPITSTEVVDSGLVEASLWAEVERVALALFERGTRVAADAGFVLADTKYEFGLSPEGALLVIDEIHTPDSSRYWDAETLGARLASGLAPEGFDKEPVRLALGQHNFGGDGPIPQLADDVWQQASDRYIALFERLTGTSFVPANPDGSTDAQTVQRRLDRALADYLDQPVRSLT